jgi:predicted secreted protein
MNMKMKLLAILIIVPMLLCLLACSSEAAVEVNCDEFRAQKHITSRLEVNAGETFAVTLCSNPSTGFSWQEKAQISDQGVLQQISHKYVAPDANSSKPPAPGSSGVEIWTFEALEKGNTIVSMEYERPWQGGEKGEWTYKLTVVVK